jgi:hypothetical protein
MKTYYRRHEIQVNSLPNGVINFDVFDNRKQHLLAGFSIRNENEQTVADRMKERVDQFISESPLALYRQ